MSKIIKLFEVHSVINQYHDKLNVGFMWFVNERDSKISMPLTELVEDYENLEKEDSLYVTNFIYEKFHESEVVKFRKLLKEHYKTEIIVEELPLPLTKEKQNCYRRA